MDQADQPAPRRMEEVMRENAQTLLAEYAAYTGLAPTHVARMLFRDGAYMLSVLGRLKAQRSPTVSFRVRTYDIIVARFSEVWPEALEWPAGVPRIGPEHVPEMPVFPPPQLPEQSADEVAQRAEAQVRTAREIERVAQITAARQQVPAISTEQGAAA